MRSPSQTTRRTVPNVFVGIDTTTTWGRRIVSGVLDYAHQHGPWHIHLASGAEAEAPLPGRVDGVIARVGSQEMAERLAALNVPVVNVSSIKLSGIRFPRVITNQEASAQIAADLFQGRGFTNFGYVGNPAAGYVQLQFSHYRRILGARGFKPAFFANLDDEAGLLRWLRRLPKPCGVFCWGPSIGRRIIDACYELGVRVPDDVAVLGSDFDDLHSRASYPPQSGIRYACEKIGMIAAETLARMMGGESRIEMEMEVEPLGVIETLSTDTLAVEDRRIADAMRFILRNFSQPIRMREVLKVNPMSRRSMDRRFRQAFGCSVAEKIRQQRINYARLLLTSTDEPITLIAEKCGFSSYNYMSRIFAKAVGMSPRDFRNRGRVARE